MRLFKPMLIDTIHVLAVFAVICMLVVLVFAREQPAWTDFIMESLAVLVGSEIVARIIVWSDRH
jgi:hypothetical protein